MRYQFLESVFGHGDDDFPLWLATVRLDVVLLVACCVAVGAWHLAPARLRRSRLVAYGIAPEIAIAAGLTLVAAALRFLVAEANLLDLGGIPYSRLLLGYKGHFATAQALSPIYRATTRDIEHAISIDRWLGTLTIPMAYVACRAIAPRSRPFAVVAAGLLAVNPLHVMVSASDALSVFSGFLLATSCALLAGGVRLGAAHQAAATLHYLGGFLGLALLTQARYENALFLAPPLVGLAIAWRAIRLRQIAPALVVFVAFGAVYAHEMATSGSSYQNPVPFSVGARVVEEGILRNGFLAVPALLVGAVAALVLGRDALGLLALAAFAVALALVSRTTDSGHHATRVFSNWLPLILVGCAHGYVVLWRHRLGRPIALVGLAWLVAQPLGSHRRLGTRYLEVLEHDAFRATLERLAGDEVTLIVPDDERMRATYHSTLELFNKYSMIRSSVPSPGVRLVGITDFLAHPRDCAASRCVFFYGLPCMEPDTYRFTPAQCDALLARHPASILDARETVSASFMRCGVYQSEDAGSSCASSMRPRRFATYRLER